MEYYKLLDFNKDPFSNSPDPDLLYLSDQHLEYLQQLEISIRLQRGLNVVLGAVGTGKTTLCRELLRRIGDETDIESYLILDPGYPAPLPFLKALWEQFSPPEGTERHPRDEQEIKNWIQNWLLSKGTEENRTIVLLIDEGQKIEDQCLELLRELLNFETNTSKLLQIVIFAQTELKQCLEARPNLWDRINLFYQLHPLSFQNTKRLIQYRIENCSRENRASVHFSLPAFWAIYKSTGGYPRRIVRLCHQIILFLIGRGEKKVTYFIVKHCIKEIELAAQSRSKKTILLETAALCFAMSVFALLILNKGYLQSLLYWEQIQKPGLTESQAIIKNNSENDTVQGVTPAPVNKTLALEPQNNTLAIVPWAKPPKVMQITANETAKTEQQSSKAQSTSIPEFLGSVQITEDENLWNMMERIYNTKEPKFLNRIVSPQLKKANSDIKDFNDISVNTVIRFPVIASLIAKAPQGYRLSLHQSESLNKSYDFYRQMIFNDILSQEKLALVPVWSVQNGLRFYVLYVEQFSSQQDVLHYIDNLPSTLKSRAVPLNWEDMGKTTYILNNLGNL